MRRIVTDLFALLEADISRHFGVTIADLIQMMVVILGAIEEELNKFQQLVNAIGRAKDVRKAILLISSGLNSSRKPRPKVLKRQ